jgi:3-oxoadipate enol-lactonase
MSLLHHRIDGPADGPLLILGPSMGTTLDLWSPQVPALSGSWRVLRYDLPGHGGSPALRGIVLEDVAAEVLALADEQGAGTFACGGVSVGGAISMLVAAAEPGRVTHLLPCCTSPRFGEPVAWFERADLVTREGMRPVVKLVADRWFTSAFPDPEPYFDMLRAADPEGYAMMCMAIARYDIHDRLSRITARTLVISGAQDPTSPPAHGEVLSAGIPGAELLVIDGAAHLANAERPAEVTGAFLRHLAR